MSRNAHGMVSVVVASLMVWLSVGSAFAQSQTPGQITQFDPLLNVVDSVITQDSGGNIGIGTTSPAAALDVATGDLNVAGHILMGGMLFLHNFGVNNTFLGQQAGNLSMTGFYNTASGIYALVNNTTGAFNTATGGAALLNNTGGLANTAVGNSALQSNTTGTGNTGIGANADVNGNLVNATAIGYGATVDASNKIRLGNGSVAVIEGQVPYTFTSDRNQKENFQAMDGEAVLQKLGGLNLSSWNYIGHDPQLFRHYGPMAQDFFAAFGHDAIGTVGTATTINSGDLDGILMAAVQALEKRTTELRQETQALRGENAELKARVEAIERRLGGHAIN